MNVGDLHKVWEIKALKRKADEIEARKILDKIAKQVQPIMRKRKWRVKVLSEFCPQNPALLGLNVGRGIHVKLRLRRPNRDDFFPFDQVLDTMLHELCHNAHGPHNASFYSLWDELRKECEELMTMGISGTGEGFDLPGRRLGGFSRQPPLSSLRQTALVAAQKRAQLGLLLPSGPKRLGGNSSIMVSLSPVQAAAMAAERRLQDDIWCGLEEVVEEEENNTDPLEKHINDRKSGSSSSLDNAKSDYTSQKRNRESSSLSESHNGQLPSDFVDLTADTLVSGSTNHKDIPTHKRTRQKDNSVPSLDACAKPSSIDLTTDTSTSTSGFTCNQDTYNTEESMWECTSCTLINPVLAPICELCGTTKPKAAKDKYKIWSCKFCTLENSVKSDKCTACDQWRYSYGQPIATPAPYSGT